MYINRTFAPSSVQKTALQIEGSSSVDDVCPPRLPYAPACDHGRSVMAACARGFDRFVSSLRLLRNPQLQHERKQAEQVLLSFINFKNSL